MVLDTPISQLNLALAGRIDFLRKTNPWRSSEDVEAERIANLPPDPDSGRRMFEELMKHAKPLPKKKAVKIQDTSQKPPESL